MYGNQYPSAPAQPYPGNYMDPYTARLAALQQPQIQPAQHYDIIQVSGEPGARAFRMAPNSRCLLLDETAPIVWLSQTDGAGYPTLTPYSITPYQPEQPAQVNSDIEERLTRLEAVIYGKPDVAAAQQTAQQPAGGTAAAE